MSYFGYNLVFVNDMLIFCCGFVIVALISFDVFQTIIVPRAGSRKLRVVPFLIGKLMWPAFRRISRRLNADNRAALLEMFAPVSFVTAIIAWFLLLIFGFACMLFALRMATHPPLKDFIEAAYFAGTSVLTLGFGDVVAAHWLARIVVLSAAVLGLIFMALNVSYLFTLQNYLAQREQVVNTLTSRAGSPASGLVLLLRYQELNIVPTLSSSFLLWESWVAIILETHRSFPLLVFFRSSDRANSWLGSIGAVLDAAVLVLTSLDGVSAGEADLFYWLACGTLKTLSAYMELPIDDHETMSKNDYLDALELLQGSGYLTKDPEKAWPYFVSRRAGYQPYLVALSRSIALPINIWMHKLPVIDFAALKTAAQEASSISEVST